MSLTHSETFAFSKVSHGDSRIANSCTTYAHIPYWPSSFPSCTLSSSSGKPAQITMEWTDITSQIGIVAGSLSITDVYGRTFVNFKFSPGAFPPSPDGSMIMKHPTYRLNDSTYTLHLSLLLYNPLVAMKAEHAELVAASMALRVPNDVCFHFPRTGRSLWSNETILRKASPYLSSLLASGFSETEPTSQSDSTSPDKTMIDPFEFEDSDEESDQMPLSKSTSQASDFGVAKFKRIDVTQATYTTYASVLCWIGSGYIAFAPLTSIKRFPSTPASPELPQPPSSLPTPASPKSVYRLAHLLELPDLVDLALGNFGKQLTSQNVAYELYTDVASTYPQIRDLAMECTVANWKEVVKSEAYKEVKKRAEAEGIDSLTATLLAEKLAAR